MVSTFLRKQIIWVSNALSIFASISAAQDAEAGMFIIPLSKKTISSKVYKINYKPNYILLRPCLVHKTNFFSPITSNV